MLRHTRANLGGITYDALSAIPLSAGVDMATIQAILAQADGFTAPDRRVADRPVLAFALAARRLVNDPVGHTTAG